MTTTLPLPGMPEPATPDAATRAADYETWLTLVRPAFQAAATTGRPFTTYAIAHAAQLPEPPDSHQWGRLMQQLADDGWVRTHAWAQSERPTTRHSGVRTWRGTAAARQGRAA